LSRWQTYFNKQKKTGLPLVEVPFNPGLKISGKNNLSESLKGLISETPVTLEVDRNYRIELTGDFNPAVLKKIIRTVREIGLETNGFGSQFFLGGPR
jgi:hypothetical protein